MHLGVEVLGELLHHVVLVAAGVRQSAGDHAQADSEQAGVSAALATATAAVEPAEHNVRRRTVQMVRGAKDLFNSRLGPGSTGAGQDVRQGDRGNSQRKPDTNNRDGYDAVAHNGGLQGLSHVERNQGHEECLGSDANPLRGKQQGLGTELSRTKDRGMPSRACVAAPTT